MKRNHLDYLFRNVTITLHNARHLGKEFERLASVTEFRWSMTDAFQCNCRSARDSGKDLHCSNVLTQKVLRGYQRFLEVAEVRQRDLHNAFHSMDSIPIH